ncbi:uncharacterized protein [Panulirus ornatus]|uniref:uncharacterized protein isoform X2 n=1 Tax=Panulirus ornatus TaxID=150431 RepID=UPI003A8365C0
MTAQMVRDKQATNTWSTIFPEEQKTNEQSVLFVKKLVAIGISSITYLRTLFPESAYGDRNLNGLKLKMLLDKSSCFSSNMVVSWIKGCFEAIEKQYLRQMTFAIYGDPKKPEEALETYTYKFFYNDEDGASISELETTSSLKKSQRKFEVRKSTEKMLRTILLLTQTLRPLPRKIHLSMKLGYYDNVTPPDYEPPGFREGGYGSYMFQSDPINIKDEKEVNGDLNKALVEDPLTPSETADVLVRSYSNHTVSCTSSTDSLSPGCSSQLKHHKASGDYHDKGEHTQALANSENQAEQDSTVDSMKQTSSVTQNLCSTTKICKLISSQDKGQLVPQISVQNADLGTASCMNPIHLSSMRMPSPLGHEGNISGPTVNIQSTGCIVGSKFEEEDDNFMVRCPCGFNQDDGLMILCDICSNWQHAVCFGVLDESEAPPHHICEACATASTPSTDPSLKDHPNLEMYCLYRRALMFLRESSCRVTVSLLAQSLGVNISVGKKLFSQLQKDKLLKRRKKGGIFANHTRVVQFAFPLYLNRDPHKDNEENGYEMIDITQTPLSMQSETGFDADMTPDLPISSLRKSINACKTGDSVNSVILSLDETLDILSESQDVTIGTQRVQVTIDSGLEIVHSETNELTQETTAETMATAGDTVSTLGSQIATGEKIATHTSAAKQKLQDSEIDEGNRERFPFNSKTKKDECARGKRRLLSGAKLSRCKKNLSSETMTLNDFEIVDSQCSDAPQEKKSKTSVDIEV